MKRATLIVWVLCSTLVVGQAATVPVYIGAKTSDGGIIDADAGITDSIADLKSELRRSKIVRIVETKDDAQVIVTVLDRGLEPVQTGTRVTREYGGSRVEPVVQRRYFLAVELTTPRDATFHKDVNGIGLGSWHGAAKRSSESIEAFAKANLATLGR